MCRKKTYINVLALLSLLALIISNVSTQVWDAFWIADPSWKISGIYTVLSSWGLPMFILTIGCFLLTNNNTLSVEYVYKKMFPKAAIGCLVWWIITALIYMKYNFPTELDTDTFFECMAAVLDSPYNIRILHLVVALWAFYPLLKRIANNKSMTFYACIVFFSVSMLLPFLENFKYIRYITLFTNQINWNFFTAFGGYLFLGIWLSNKTFEWHHRMVIYCLGALSTVAMFACTVFWSAENTGFDHRFVAESSPFVLFQVVAIFVLTKAISDKAKNTSSTNSILNQAVEASYAMIPGYVISQGLVSYLITVEKIPIAFSIPLEAVICFLFSLAIGLCIKKIPLISYFTA